MVDARGRGPATDVGWPVCGMRRPKWFNPDAESHPRRRQGYCAERGHRRPV